MTYLDAASGLPLHPAARAVLDAAHDDGWADPVRLYREGRRARQLWDSARASVAAVLRVRPDEVTFTPSGTVANLLAVHGAVQARARTGGRVVASAVEHSSVLTAAPDATLVGVDRLGRVDPDAFVRTVTPDTALACLQSANHEVGTVQPVAEVAAGCAAAAVPLLVDAAQAIGRVGVDGAVGGLSLLTGSAHKWGGPPGVGVLVVRTGTRFRSPFGAEDGAAGRWPGFGNLPGALAAAAALEARVGEMAEEAARLSKLVDAIRAAVPRLVPDTEVVGDPVHRLPHLVTFSCLYVDGEALVTELDRLGFAVNSGSACTSAALRPSHVLEAMGVLSQGNVRVSLHGGVSATDVRRFLDVLPGVVARLRAVAGADRL